MKPLVELAREAGFSVKDFKPPVITAQHSNGSWVGIGENLERFAGLVRADERLKAEPAQRKRLTTDEYVQALGPLLSQIVCSSGTLHCIVRTIEAQHNIKE